MSAACPAVVCSIPMLSRAGQMQKDDIPETNNSTRSEADFGKGSRIDNAIATATMPASIERKMPAVSPLMYSTTNLLAIAVPLHNTSARTPAAVARDREFMSAPSEVASSLCVEIARRTIYDPHSQVPGISGHTSQNAGPLLNTRFTLAMMSELVTSPEQSTSPTAIHGLGSGPLLNTYPTV